MNKFLLTLALLSFFSAKIYAQLDSVYFTSLPCFGAPGITGTITASYDSNATYYEWTYDTTNSHINAIWFPNSPGPIQTSVPNVNVLFNQANPYYVICVTAFSACCTSNTFCDTVWGIVPIPVLSATNNIIGIPNDSGYYTVVIPAECPPAGYSWTITGDATFNNAGQTIMGGPGVNINFGPNFTSGILCVNGFTNFGLPSDTVCMVINAPVGLNEPYSNFNFISDHDKVILEFSSTISDNISMKLFDVSGKNISNEPVFVNTNQNHLEFSTAHLNPGIYFLELTGNIIHKQFKFAVTQ